MQEIFYKNRKIAQTERFFNYKLVHNRLLKNVQKTI